MSFGTPSVFLSHSSVPQYSFFGIIECIGSITEEEQIIYRTDYLFLTLGWFMLRCFYVSEQKNSIIEKIDELGLHVILWFKCNMFRYNFQTPTM